MTSADRRTAPAPLRTTAEVFRFNALLAGLAWSLWAILARARGWHSLVHHWQVALTMVFGSLVGGGTSEGGAAIAFPVFTKLLQIPASEARLFSFAIQTVGMGTASLSILYQRTPIERRVLPWAGAGGVAGLLLSTFLLLPRVPSPLVRVFFTALVTSLALVLLWPRRRGLSVVRHRCMPVLGSREQGILFAAGVLGGALSGLIGCGENIVLFMVLVVLFRMDESVVTPTTVLLMWVVTAAAFLLHVLVLRDVPPHVVDYWLAGVPVVVVGAPLGAFVCSRVSRRAIVAVLVGLIGVELVSTLWLVGLRRGTGLLGLATLLGFGALNGSMRRSTRYDQPVSQQVSELTH